MYTNLNVESNAKISEYLLEEDELEYLNRLAMENLQEAIAYEEEKLGYSEDDDAVEFYMKMG